jgi:hypothetical protein
MLELQLAIIADGKPPQPHLWIVVFEHMLVPNQPIAAQRIENF